MITDVLATDPRLAPFRSLTDAALRRATDAAHGTYIAESMPVIERALAAGHRVRSVLIAPRLREQIEALRLPDTDVFVADGGTVEAITGYDVHRGALAVVERPPARDVAAVLTGGTIVVLDGVTDATNVGAIFRNAAALGASAVLLTPGTGDPLYRRSVRVSMGTVFRMPWAQTTTWPDLAATLHAAGYTIAALALDDAAVPLEEFAPTGPVALVLGAEGPGLSDHALAAADVTVMVPMDGGVDSLNVAAASALALYAVRAAGRS